MNPYSYYLRNYMSPGPMALAGNPYAVLFNQLLRVGGMFQRQYGTGQGKTSVFPQTSFGALHGPSPFSVDIGGQDPFRASEGRYRAPEATLTPTYAYGISGGLS